MKKIFLLFVGVFFLCAGIVQASNIDITIKDKNFSTTIGWYGQQEDNEVEPGMETGQKWDLEGFFLDSTKLSLVGGYDFKKGQSVYTSGDIFIDITGNAVYGDIHGTKDGNTIPVSNTYGYDYVLDLDWTKDLPTYDVYRIDANSMVKTAFYKQNQGSSPWLYVSGGEKILTSQELKYSEKASGYNDIFKINDNGTGWHNELIVDLGFLPHNVSFITHYTMGCGNDNIMGQGTTPNPEPATMLLLGFGLLGVAGLGRKKMS